MKKSRFDKFWILIILLVLFHAINNYIILQKNTTPLVYDQIDNYIISLRFYDALKESPYEFFKQYRMYTVLYPPLFLVPSVPAYVLFGKNQDVAIMTNVVYLAILLFSIYGIGKKLYSKKVGLLAAFIVSTFPGIFGFSRVYMPAFALTAMVSLGIYLLLMTNNFRNRKYCVLFGIAAGLGMLIRWSYIIYIIGPFLVVLFNSFFLKKIKRSTKFSNKFILVNLIISIVLGVIIAATWYFPNILKSLSHITLMNSFINQLNGSYKIFSISSFYTYIGILILQQIYLFYFILFIVCLIYFLIIKNKNKLFFLLWLIIPYLVFTFEIFKRARYTLPFLPAIALIIAVSIFKIPLINSIKKIYINKLYLNKVVKIIFVLVLFVGIIQFFMVSYGKYTPINIQERVQHDAGELHDNGLLYATFSDWKTKEILSLFDGIENKTIVAIPRTGTISVLQNQIIYENKNKFIAIFLCISTGLEWCYSEYSELDIFPLHEQILKADYVITQGGGDFGIRHHKKDGREWKIVIEPTFKTWEENKDKFDLIKSLEMPDNSTLLIYKRR